MSRCVGHGPTKDAHTVRIPYTLHPGHAVQTLQPAKPDLTLPQIIPTLFLQTLLLHSTKFNRQACCAARVPGAWAWRACDVVWGEKPGSFLEIREYRSRA